jgi:uridine kinase
MKRELSGDLCGDLSGDMNDSETPTLRGSQVLKIKIPIIPAKIILIAGPSASGKTTIARSICIKFERAGIKAKCVSMDNFYRSLEEHERGDTFNWDSISAFNIGALLNCIRSWKRGLSCWIPEHNFSEYKSVEYAEYIVPSQVMIIEGIHALSVPDLVALADLRLFITCDHDEALARRITRDIKERGYDIDTILTRYFTYVKPALRDTIVPSQKNADHIIANPNNGELSRENTLELIVGEIVARMQKK